MLKISKYKPEDYNTLATLYEDVARRTFAYDTSRFVSREQFNSLTEGEDVWTLSLGQTSIGFLGYYAPEHFLHSIYIDYAYHKHGYGREALSFLLANYKTKHELKVDRVNLAALNFYFALGYEDVTAEQDAHQSWFRLRSPASIKASVTTNAPLKHPDLNLSTPT